MEVVLLIAITLLLSAFFSGMEIAFVSANKLKLELDKKSNSFTSKIISIFTKQESHFIVSMLIGNNIALVVYGVLMAQILEFNLSETIPSASVLFIHFAINIGMTIGLTPVIGIPLPFISYGGSSLIGFTILLFIFLNLDSYRLQILR